MENEGEIIITLESEERHYSYNQLNVGFGSSDTDIVNAITPIIREEFGMNIDSEFQSGYWTVKRVEASNNTYVFPKSTAGIAL